MTADTEHRTEDERRSGLENPDPKRASILFVVPLGERNGATTALLHLLRWFRAAGGRPSSTLFGKDGELVPEYAELGRAWPAERSPWCPGGLRAQTLEKCGLGPWASKLEKREVRNFVGSSAPELIYVNSVTREGARLVKILDFKVPVIMHVHEQECMLELQAQTELSDVLSRATRFVACSEAVRTNLIQGHAIAPDRVETIHAAIPAGQVRATRSRAEILQELDFPADADLVLGCGTLWWVKAPDAFVQVARTVCQRNPRAHFVWVGRGSALDTKLVQRDIRLMGLSGRVRLLGATRHPADYMAAADVFALTSREDSFPLACLEAAALGKPIVCFADAGGMPEFVEGDCGYVVPYLDSDAMAERVLCLLDSPGCRIKMGANARRKVEERHDVSVAGPKFMDIIERTIAAG